jgi:hypothetical protein
MAQRTCTKDGCHEPHRAKGLCGKHYREARAERLAQQQCKAEGCENPQGESAGYCIACYQRFLEYGDPAAGPPRRRRRRSVEHTGTRSPYFVNHAMVRKARGPAWRQRCAHCDAPAADWATMRGATGESPDDYIPLCRSCHSKYDGKVANLSGRRTKHSPATREKQRQAALRRWAAPGARAVGSESARQREARKREAREQAQGPPQAEAEESPQARPHPTVAAIRPR